MDKKFMRGLLCGALLAAGSASMAAQPQVLSDAALDGVTAGYVLPSGIPLGAAFAYAYSSAFEAPGLNAIVDIDYSAQVGANQAPVTAFNYSLNFFP